MLHAARIEKVTMSALEVVECVPYTPKRRPASPVYTDPLGGAGHGAVIVPDTYQPVFDQPRFQVYQDNHVYEELKPIVDLRRRPPEKPPLPARHGGSRRTF